MSRFGRREHSHGPRVLKGAEPPKKVLSEMNKTSTLLRDMLNPSFNKIVVNTKEMYDETQKWIESWNIFEEGLKGRKSYQESVIQA